MKITTESGTVYLHRGVFLTRISERPIYNRSTYAPVTDIIHNEVIESCNPISPVIGKPIYYCLRNGVRFTTTPVVSIDPEYTPIS
jgi:hypothetical protein